MTIEKETSKKGALNLYVGEDLKKLLKKRSETWSRSPSAIVSALIKILEKLPLAPDDEIVEKAIKKTIGREQFMLFLKGVQAALPLEARPIIPPTANGEGTTREYQPDMWELPHIDTIVMAYFAPSEENFGVMLSRVLTEKVKNKASCVVVACADTSSIPKGQREEMLKIGIAFVALGDLRQCLEEAMANAKRKPTKSKR